MCYLQMLSVLRLLWGVIFDNVIGKYWSKTNVPMRVGRLKLVRKVLNVSFFRSRAVDRSLGALISS